MARGFLVGLFALVIQGLSQTTVSVQALSDSDICPQCTPYTCRRISGIYTVTVLSAGTYNPVVEIPASACNINITELARSENYIAMRTKRGDGIINSKWALGQPGQYYGAGVRFSYDRRSGSCKGSCIYSLGPTSEDVVVQILYYDKNPGITYEFVLPNSVSFDPLNGISETSPASVSSGEAPQKITFARKETGNTSSRHRARSRTHPHRQRIVGRHHGRHRGEDEDSLREHHPDPQMSWSEGRPDMTSAAEGGPPQVLSAGTSYGSHTLDGRGLSYTYGGSAQSGSSSKTRSRSSARTSRHRDRKTSSGRHVIERYRPGSSSSSSSSSSTSRGVRPASTPRYVSSSRRQNNARRRGSPVTSNYIRTPRYQSFTGAGTSYLSQENKAGTYDRSSRYNRGSLRVSNSLESTSKQYRWKISGFSECSHTCGGGFQKTNIVCVSLGSRTQVVVTPENCANHLKPRQQTVACNKKPCPPAWEAEVWSECSVTCGSGTQTRKVECRQRYSSTLTLRVSADECGLNLKPAVAQQCSMGLCSQWSVGPWSQCEECGDGERRREVRCLDAHDSPIPGNYCTDARPISSEPCDTRPCTVDWWLSDWSLECSVLCGEGTRTRRALCMNDKGVVIDERLCEKKELPILEEQCRSDAGCRGTWFTGAWGKCSSDCGEGMRYRQVVCVHQTSGRSQGQLIVTSDIECDFSIKPETEETCTQANCEAVWFSGPWGQCSVTCGDGYMSRNVRCIIDKNEDKSSGGEQRLSEPRESTLCVANLRPDTRKVCAQRPCPQEPRYQRTNRYEPGRYVDYVGDRGAEYAAGAFVEGGREETRYRPREEDNAIENESDDFVNKYKSSSTRGSYKRKTERKLDASVKKCTDKIDKCRMVLQARLCPYPFYQRVCCHSCRKYVLRQ